MNLIKKIFAFSFHEIFKSLGYNIQKQSTVDDKNRQIEETLFKEKLFDLRQISSGIAHEINNPLTIISGKTDQLRFQLKKNHPLVYNEFESSFASIEKNCLRIANSINDLRGFSKDHAKEEKSHYYLSFLLDQALSLCGEKFKFDDIELIIEPVQKDPKIHCRQSEISQILYNILKNSYYSLIGQDEKKWVKIKTKISKNILFIYFEDSSAKINKSLHDKIFQPFFSTHPSECGSGMDIRIAKIQIRQLGGDLYIEDSSLNNCLVLTIPIFEAAS